jgi:hypothetical protein
MTDTPPKPKRRRWQWLVVGLLLLALLAMWGSSLLHQRRLRAWVKSVNDGNISAFIVARREYVGPSFGERLRSALSGYRCIVVVDDRSEAENLLGVSGCPLPLELWIKPGVPSDTVQHLRERFDGAKVVENSPGMR